MIETVTVILETMILHNQVESFLHQKDNLTKNLMMSTHSHEKASR